MVLETFSVFYEFWRLKYQMKLVIFLFDQNRSENNFIEVLAFLLHQHHVNHKINYALSLPRDVYVPVKLINIQRLECVLEIIEIFHDDISGSKLAAAFRFSRILYNF